MIRHALELWVTLAASFLLGCLAGSLIYRTVALTAAARLQSRLVHGIDRALRVIEWRLLPWRSGGPVPLPRVVPMPPPDFSHAAPVLPPLPSVWEDVEIHIDAPTLEPIAIRSVFDDERIREAVERADAAGARPAVLAAPRQATPDDLLAIRGLGKRHVARLAKIGIYHFSQIAAWTPQEAAWIGTFLGIGPDAVKDRDWVGQATRVAGSDDPEAAARPPPKKPPKARAKRGKAKKASPGGTAAARKPKGRPRAKPKTGAVSPKAASEPNDR